MIDQKSPSPSKPSNWNTALFWFGVSFTIAAPIVLGTYLGDHSTSWISALCGAFIVFVSRLDEIAELSLGPVKAKMREVINEANAKIEQVQKIAKDIAKPTLATLMAGNFGFQDGMNLEKRLRLHDEMIANLEEIGISEEDIFQIDENWRDGIGVIYHRAISPLMGYLENSHRINTDATEKERQDGEGWKNLFDEEKWKGPTPDEMTKFFVSREILTSEIDEWISDYRHFLETGEIRRHKEFVAK